MTQPPVLLQHGYCVKSPPQEKFNKHRWRKRWFTLSVEEIKDLDKFYKKKNKGDNGANLSAQKSKYLILSYFNQQADEDKNRPPIKRFILDGSQIDDEPNGQHGNEFAIRIQLSADHDSRLMYLCFDNKEEHGIWLSQLTGYFEQAKRKDSLQVEQMLCRPFKSQPMTDNPVQKALSEFRKEISEERDAITRSLLDEVYEEYNAGKGEGEDYPCYSEIDSGTSKLDEGYSGKSENDKGFEDLNLEPDNTDSGIFVD